MNPTLSVIIRTFRPKFCRYLSVQSSVNKSSNSFNRTPDFHQKIENLSSSFPLFRRPFRNSLCNASLPLCTGFHRNFTQNSEDPLDLDKPAEPEVWRSTIVDTSTLQQEIWETTDRINEIISSYGDNVAVKYAENLFLEMHDVTGLPWWASIALTAVLVRTTMVLPLSLTQVLHLFYNLLWMY